ncbi:MAG TPA: ABC transporter permease subunit, partial [Mycobacteriales bacterium]|nr:ABC transporter permease subunit [Mycobacteriales bacterium]
KINVATLTDSVGNAVDFTHRMLPLDFPPAGELLRLCGQTLSIVVCATLLSVIISIPLALLAARNITEAAPVRGFARTLIVIARAIPDVVFAIVAFRIFGLGGLTGIVAMGLHSVGMVGKLYADTIEHLDEGQRRAVRATGASGWQELTVGVFPQVLPALLATALHRLDINLRVSVVLGFVGVNGLGYAIANAVTSLDYQRGMALALVVVALCVAVELACSGIRHRLLTGGKSGRSARLAAPGQISPPWTVRRAAHTTAAVAAACAIIACGYGADISGRALLDAPHQTVSALRLFVPPSTGGIASTLFSDLWLTVKIALASTLIGFVLAVPMGLLAARNVSPLPRFAAGFRTLIVLVRGIPELILGIVFVVITGLGAVAATLALSVGAVGLLGKLIADSLEEIEPGVLTAIRATGAGRLQVLAAVVPCVAPALVAHGLYQLDVNIRSATLLGIVGAGGIGYDLLNAARVQEFGVVTTVLLMVLAIVLAVEAIAIGLRRTVS